ncbi:hypothetical protein HMPREF3201_01985 [Megasphaera sp. MJR8396C]|nr:hypothetical protein HMPREF3201_01985 [Megasphaera sp. MJR8396C]
MGEEYRALFGMLPSILYVFEEEHSPLVQKNCGCQKTAATLYENQKILQRNP